MPPSDIPPAPSPEGEPLDPQRSRQKRALLVSAGVAALILFSLVLATNGTYLSTRALLGFQERPTETPLPPPTPEPTPETVPPPPTPTPEQPPATTPTPVLTPEPSAPSPSVPPADLTTPIPLPPIPFTPASTASPSGFTSSPSLSELQSLTEELRQLKNDAASSARVMAGSPNSALERLKEKATLRRDTLTSALRAGNVNAVLTVAFSAAERTTFPADIQPLLEQPVTLTGEWGEGHADDFVNQKAHYFFGIIPQGATSGKPVYTEGNVPPKEALRKSGWTVTLEGVELEDKIGLKTVTPSSGAKRTLVKGVQAIRNTATPVPQVKGVFAVPAYNSLPGAPVSLYLDFDGHFESEWGTSDYQSISTPPFDLDRNTSSFNDEERAAIRRIYSQVAEDFMPFSINVTTVEPPNCCGNYTALRVSIGGDGRWLNKPYTLGKSLQDSFTNSYSNTVFVFSEKFRMFYRPLA